MQEVCSQYWPTPEEGSVTHGEFIITAGSVKPGKLAQRSFSVVHQMQVGYSVCVLVLL